MTKKRSPEALDAYLRGRPHATGNQDVLDAALAREARQLADRGMDPAAIARRLRCRVGVVREMLERTARQ